MKYLKRFFAGAAIGVGAAIPGVSGAAIALIFKIYNDIIEAVGSFKKHIGYSLKVLIPILLGIIVALIPCIIVFKLAFQYMMFVLICVFAGFLIGSLPSITDEVKNIKPSKTQIIICVISFAFVILLGILSVVLGDKINLQELFTNMPVWLYFVLIPIGAIAAIALTVPGLSGSMILLVIGFYRPLIDHTYNWCSDMFKLHDFSNTGKLFGMLGCFALGCLIGVIFISKVMTYLLNKHKASTYFAIIGFVIGSIFVLFFNYEIFNYYKAMTGLEIINVSPILKPYIEIPLGILILLICVFASYQIVRYQRKEQNKNASK